MKPRIFIGSSTESIDIAYAIQENLDYDAEVTVWSQGIFKLSSNTIDDLLKVLDNCDYGIFIFSPDDVITIREKTGTITRDNVIFELGLFVGKLGKERVFYITPRGKKDLHIPSDLLPMMPGNYDAERNDGNLKAALGPFCNQIRQQLKDFLYQNLQDIATESKEVKILAINKPTHWQHLMFAQLLDEKIKPVLKGYEEIEKGIIFIPKESVEELSDILIHMRKLFFPARVSARDSRASRWISFPH